MATIKCDVSDLLKTVANEVGNSYRNKVGNPSMASPERHEIECKNSVAFAHIFERGFIEGLITVGLLKREQADSALKIIALNVAAGIFETDVETQIKISGKVEADIGHSMFRY